MDLYCAIDVRDGAAVRLTQGDFRRQRTYGDPLELALRLAASGAPWLHVVDLDAARAGRPVNRPVVLAIAAAVVWIIGAILPHIPSLAHTAAGQWLQAASHWESHWFAHVPKLKRRG